MSPELRSLPLLLLLLGCGSEEPLGPAPLRTEDAQLQSAECAQGQPVAYFAQLVDPNLPALGVVTRLTVTLWWEHRGATDPLSQVVFTGSSALPRSVALCVDPARIQAGDDLRVETVVETADRRVAVSGTRELSTSFYPWQEQVVLMERRVRQVQ